jgi:hypothetical protein
MDCRVKPGNDAMGVVAEYRQLVTLQDQAKP